MRLGPQAHRVYEMLKHQITTGNLSPGDKLPPNMDLATQYGVALVTVRHALARLRTEGLLSSRQGVGTFVRASVGLSTKAVLIIEGRNREPTYLNYDHENAPCRIIHVTDAMADLPGLAATVGVGGVFIDVNLLRNEDSAGLLETLLAAFPKSA